MDKSMHQKAGEKVAGLLLIIMFVLMMGSSINDSATMDELAHIPAGYSYVKLKDYRLNPEHPPLIKDLAAIPLLFLKLNFPTDIPSWRDDINGQWTQGAIFLYESGNNPDYILFWARLPVILLALLFGWLIWRYTLKQYGEKVALLTLFLYAFSPTFIAHSRLVTTDLAATFGFFIGLIAFLKFLEDSGWQNIAITGLALGTALLLKFSLFLLVILQVFLLIIWILINPFFRHFRFSVGSKLIAKYALVLLIAAILIWPVYLFHVWNYPPERQKSDTTFILTSFAQGPDPKWESCNPGSGVPLGRRVRCLAELAVWASDKPMLRPWARWLSGFLMVIQRSAGGNTAFFMGEVSAAGWKYYFPTLYLVKEPLAYHILSLIALSWVITRIIKRRGNYASRIKTWIQNHFSEFAFISFIFLYWVSSIKSPLNIGIRHILPTFPFMYMLISSRIVQWIELHDRPNPQNWWEWLKETWNTFARQTFRYALLGVLLFWLVFGTVKIFPHYIAYFNELAGGPKNGYKIVADSNLDWGQDLKRLRDFVEQNNIQKIAMDYFGGGNPRYYLDDKFEPWSSARGPARGWFAISATFRQGAFGKLVPGQPRKPEDEYLWLQAYEPVTTIGHSIFVYYLP